MPTPVRIPSSPLCPLRRIPSGRRSSSVRSSELVCPSSQLTFPSPGPFLSSVTVVSPRRSLHPPPSPCPTLRGYLKHKALLHLPVDSISSPTVANPKHPDPENPLLHSQKGHRTLPASCPLPSVTRSDNGERDGPGACSQSHLELLEGESHLKNKVIQSLRGQLLC